MLKLPKDSNDVRIENPRIAISDQMYNKIRDACKFRPTEAKDLFLGEMTWLPECFVKKDDGTPYYNAKSDIVPIISDGCIAPVGKVDGLIIDLSVIIRAQAAIAPLRKTFSDFSSLVLKNIEKLQQINMFSEST